MKFLQMKETICELLEVAFLHDLDPYGLVADLFPLIQLDDPGQDDVKSSAEILEAVWLELGTVNDPERLDQIFGRLRRAGLTTRF